MSEAEGGRGPRAGDPEPRLEEVARGRAPGNEDRASLLERARATMVDALTDLHAIAAEMLGHLEHGADGPWEAEEAICYTADRRRERDAHRRYLAAQSWHDTIRRRSKGS